MSFENALGPLWEGEPKVGGFRLAIPNPHELHAWALRQPKSSGELPLRSDLQVYDDLRKFFSGESNKIIQRERIWSLDIEDDLFKSLDVQMDAAYSLKHGEWASILANLDYSEIAFELNKHMEIPKLAPSIALSLGEKLSNSPCVYESDSLTGISVPGLGETTNIRIILGYATRQAAASDAEVDQDPEELLRTGLIIPVGDHSTIPLSLLGMLNSLQRFQYVLPHIVDTFYEVLDLTPPNLTLSLSSEYELK